MKSSQETKSSGMMVETSETQKPIEQRVNENITMAESLGTILDEYTEVDAETSGTKALEDLATGSPKDDEGINHEQNDAIPADFKLDANDFEALFNGDKNYLEEDVNDIPTSGVETSTGSNDAETTDNKPAAITETTGNADSEAVSEATRAHNTGEKSEPALEQEKNTPLTPEDTQRSSVEALKRAAQNPSTNDAKGILLLAETVKGGHLPAELVPDVQNTLRDLAIRIPNMKTERDHKINSEQQIITEKLAEIDKTPLQRGQKGYLEQQIERTSLTAQQTELQKERATIRAQKQTDSENMLALAEQANRLTEADPVAEDNAENEEPTANNPEDSETKTPQTGEKKPVAQTSRETSPAPEAKLPEEINSELEFFEKNINKMTLEQLRSEQIRTEQFRILVASEQEINAVRLESTTAMLEMSQGMQLHYDTIIAWYKERRRPVPETITESRERMVQQQEELTQRLEEINLDAKLLEDLDAQATLYGESIQKRITDMEESTEDAGYELPVGIFDMISSNPYLEKRLMSELRDRKKDKREAPTSLMDWFFLLFQLRK